MIREEKIRAIYEEMASKEVAFGCRYEHNGSRYVVDSWNYRLMKHWDLYYLYIDAHCNCPIKIVKQYNDFSNQWVVEIIGHPVMIWDVLDWIEPYWMGCAQSVEISNRKKRKKDLLILQWDNKRTPIEDQSDGCIDYVYSLIQKD